MHCTRSACLFAITLTLGLLCGCSGKSVEELMFGDMQRAFNSPPTPIADPYADPSTLNAPWNIGSGVDPDPPRTIWLSPYLSKRDRLRSVVVSSHARRALLTFERHQVDQHNPKKVHVLDRAIWIDLANKQVISEFKINPRFIANAIHPSGEWAVLRGPGPDHGLLEVLHLVRFSPDGTATHQHWCPLLGSNVDGKIWRTGKIAWVDFVGEDFLATVSGDVLHLWSRADLRHVATFDETRGLPCVTPDGRKIAFATRTGVALVDPMTQSVVAFESISKLPRKPTLTFDHSGTRLAVVDRDQTILFNTHTREQATYYTTHVSKGSYSSRPNIGWVGGYLCSSSSLIDLRIGIPVMVFVGSEWASPVGNQLWAVVKNKGQERSLRSYAVSTQAIGSKVRKVLGGADPLPWRKGKKVRIDVVNLPKDRQADAHKGLTKLLIKQGFIPDYDSDLVLKASIPEKLREKSVTYNIKKSEGQRWKQSFDYRSRYAKLEIIRSGKTIWSKERASSAPFMISGNEASINAQLAELDEPGYSLFEKVSLPEFIRDKIPGAPVRLEFTSN